MFGPYLVWAVRVSTVFRGSLIHAATPSMHADISCDTDRDQLLLPTNNTSECETCSDGL